MTQLINRVPPVTIQQLEESVVANGIQKVVVGAVILIQGNVLLLQRKADNFMGGLVELPSGNVDPGETIISALVREVLEETGLHTTTIDQYIGSFDYKSSGGKKVRQFNFRIRVQPDNIVLAPQEHERFHLVPPTIGNLDWFNMSQETKRTILVLQCHLNSEMAPQAHRHL